jgi:hypothetical protein
MFKETARSALIQNFPSVKPSFFWQILLLESYSKAYPRMKSDMLASFCLRLSILKFL